MVIENNKILYFSGTGNSLKVAKDLQNELKNIELLKVVKLTNEKEINIKSKILGIVFPVYYARPPLAVESFVKKLKIDKHTYVFAVATFGGGPAKVLLKLNEMLKNNGTMLNSGFLIQMPGNNIFSYGSLPAKIQNILLTKESKKIKKISNVIKERKNQKYEVSKLKIDTLIDQIFIKSTNKIMDNLHMRDEKFWVNEDCIDCKLCEKICPVNNIKFNLNKPVWKHNCEQCAACIQFCPKKAIEWGSKTSKRKRYKNPDVTVDEMI